MLGIGIELGHGRRSAWVLRRHGHLFGLASGPPLAWWVTRGFRERNGGALTFTAWMRSVVQSAVSLFNKLRGTASTLRSCVSTAAGLTTDG
jgi:hypothetical protein